jgi:HEAT repeat protein
VSRIAPRIGFLTVLAALILGISTSASAVEVYDNAKLLKAVKAGVSLDVILQQIQANGTNCRFDSSNDAIIEIQVAGKEGGMKIEEIKALQKRVIEVAGLDQKRLKELVDKALNVFENADANEYDLTMRALQREGKPVVPYLLKQFEQESERKRSGLVDALGRIGDKSDEVVKIVNMLLIDRSKPVRLQTAKTVAALATEKTSEDMVARLNQRNASLDGAAMAIGYIGDANPKAIEALAKLLRASGDSDARVCAAWSLGQLRARTPVALDALLEAVLDERDEKLRDSAGLALGVIGDKRAPSYIMRAFQRYRAGREDLVRHLSYFKDAEGIEFLIEQADNDSPPVKKAVNETLKVISNEQHLEGTEEWRGWWEVNKVRPDFRASDGPKVPDPAGDRAQKKSDTGELIPTSTMQR